MASEGSCKVETLEGKRCLITGATRGIGRSIAVLFAKSKPAVLFLSGRNENQLKQVAEECRKQGAPRVEVCTADFSTASSVENLAKTVLSERNNNYGVDVLVNNAGQLTHGSAVSGDVSQWAGNVNVNLLSPMILTRLLSEKMVARENGVIINVSSVSGVEGMAEEGLYSATKFGLRGWSLHCYKKLRYHNIKVMLINPAFVATDMTEHRNLLNEFMIQPEDVAEVAMLPFRTTTSCCPEEIVLRLTRSPYPGQLPKSSHEAA